MVHTVRVMWRFITFGLSVAFRPRTRVNPQTDMVVLCANCHRMIHRNRDGMLSPDELRSLTRR